MQFREVRAFLPDILVRVVHHSAHIIENEVTVINDSDSDSDRSPKISPRRKKKNKDEQSMPAWTKTMRAVS